MTTDEKYMAIEIRNLKAHIAELEAENARLRVDGPIAVGDVVQITSEENGFHECFTVTQIDGDRVLLELPDEDDFCWTMATELTRIGRAVRMPDGTPVEPA